MSRELKFRIFDMEQYRYFDSLADMELADYEVMCDLRCFPIEQYTGLHDAEGREIWEGDIVESAGGRRSAIFKRLGCWYISGMCELGYYESYLKVIGNSHYLYYNETMADCRVEALGDGRGR